MIASYLKTRDSGQCSAPSVATSGLGARRIGTGVNSVRQGGNENGEDKMSEDGDVRDNLENWNDRAEVHANGGYGDLDALADDDAVISPVVLRDFDVLRRHLPSGNVSGLRLLHLQCHIGTDTLGWYRLGAVQVHGLDFSAASLGYARRLAERAGAAITYVEGDARRAADVMPSRHGTFDVVVTSAGTITWLPDLDSWALSIATLLAPGGMFMIRDNHPLLFALDNSGLQIVEGYFSGTESTYDSDASYTAGSQGMIAHVRNHNWAHDFHEMTGALLHAGLVIDEIGEHRVTDWQALPMLVFDDAAQGWRMPEDMPQIPLTFSIVAHKPTGAPSVVSS